ncbi:MAG: NAD(P)-dependent oxidoreductase [Actinomycetia bacterium]|nr:NAD(P)-dependent oxidoreductase [Actinomycetes bacterium]MCP5035412.1 NAD(P)-dependent oxidoreductase [Actinomycetes bacterium]
MRILITGSTGFVGRYVMADALRRGHKVRAVVRPSSSGSALGSLLDDSALESVGVDLRSSDGLDEALDGVDCVIHLAAAKAGDFYTQFAGTVIGTENLLRAMSTVGVRQLVGVSTFSVYDYLALKTGELLDEESPIDLSPTHRDEYSRTKLLQEELYREFGQAEGHKVVILRPGMIYGRHHLWHALLGAELGPFFLRIGSRATLPLAYVENCAEAMVMAAKQLADEPSRLTGQTINIIDDHLPSQGAYIEAVSKVMDPPSSIRVPWFAMQAAADLLDRGNDIVVGGRAKFPGFIVPDRLHARFKPLRFTNAKVKRIMGWSPRYAMAEAIERSASGDDLLAIDSDR